MDMAPNKRLLNILLYTGIAFCVLQIWLPGHYLTCDGPCHLYNARIVHDLWTGVNTWMHSRFYDLVYSTDPNSLTTFALATLLYAVKGAVAEKIFLTIYVVIFITGFVALLRRLNGGDSYWLLCALLFPFTYAFAKGFYNFSFSIAFWFWMVWSWLQWLETRKMKYAALFFLFTGLIFFTHLLPFVFGVFTCASLVLSGAIYRHREDRNALFKTIGVNGGILALMVFPFLALMFRFTNSAGGMNIHLRAHLYRMVELVEFKYLINLTDTERPWALVTGLVFTGLFVMVCVHGARRFRLHRYDGLLLSLLFVTFVYVFFPEEFMGHMIVISIRAQLFVYILVVCIVAYRMREGMVKVTGMALICVCFLLLGIARISCRYVADEALNEYLQANEYIKPGKVVLPFDFAPTGRTAAGKEITNRNALFHHAAQYIAVDKPLVMLDNYEANMGYFPVRWAEDTNPYNHLSKGAGIEGVPPYATIETYKQKTGVTVDYVLLWCYNEAYRKDAAFNTLYEEINRMYHLVYTSPTGRVILYERNTEAVVVNDIEKSKWRNLYNFAN